MNHPWPLFRTFLQTVLVQNHELAALSKDAETKNEAFEELLHKLDSILKMWWKTIESDYPNAVGGYYLDEAAMVTYEARQVAAVPGREELFRMAIDSLRHRCHAPVLEVCSGSGAGALRLARRGAIAVATDAFPILSAHADGLEREGVRVLRDLAKGDLRGSAWRQKGTYEPLLGTKFNGFSGILGFMGLPLIADRASVYRGMHDLLINRGRISIVHDPEAPGRPLPTSAQTVRSIARNLHDQGRSKTLLEITANLLMRRGILHNERRMTLDEEVALIGAVFGNYYVERHPRYREWVVFSAEKR